MGKFNGRYTLTPIGPDLFLFDPDPIVGFTWTSNSGRVVKLDAMITDGATIPRYLRWIKWMSPTSVTDAACVHDALYEQKHRGQAEVGFFEANWFLFEAIGDLEYGVPLSKRLMYLAGTCAFGWWWWYRKIFDWNNIFGSEETK